MQTLSNMAAQTGRDGGIPGTGGPGGTQAGKDEKARARRRSMHDALAQPCFACPLLLC